MHRSSDPARLAGALLISLVSLAGCAMESYRAAPLDPSISAQSFEARTLDAPALKEYMLAHGHPASAWPVERWGLAELTLLVFYYHPDLEIARAQAKAVRAEAAAAAPRWPLAITPLVQHHSLQIPGEQTGPWSVGFEVHIPLAPASPGEAIRDRYDALAQAADLKVGAAAWNARSNVRARLLDLYANQTEAALMQSEVRARETLLTLFEQRLQVGAASSVEVNNARLALIDAQTRLQVAQASGQRALNALAQALALPLPVVHAMRFDYGDLQRPAPVLQDVETRRAALLNRLDI